MGQDPNPSAELMTILRSFWQRQQVIPQHVQVRLQTAGQAMMPGTPYFAKRLTRGEALGPKVDRMEFDWSTVQMKHDRFADGIVVTKGDRAWLFKTGIERLQRRPCRVQPQALATAFVETGGTSH